MCMPSSQSPPAHVRTTVWHAHHVLPHRRSAQVAANLQKLAMKPEPRRADRCCAGVAAAWSHAVHHGGDAARAWAAPGCGVGTIDAYGPVHASPTAWSEGLRDGLHPQPASDEALAVNQLLMNWLCASGAPDAEASRARRDWAAEKGAG